MDHPGRAGHMIAIRFYCHALRAKPACGSREQAD
jgi:hypothetical protein